MAGLFKRGDYWWASWKVGRKSVRKSTGIKVREAGMSKSAAEALARQTAGTMEAVSKGNTACSRAIEAVRAAAVAFGGAAKMPSVKDYLAGIPRTAGEKSEATRRHVFARFVAFLGAAANLGIDTVTPAACSAFLREVLGQVSKGTAESYRVYLSAAFNRAVKVDGLLDRNPLAGVNLAKEAAAVNPERGADKQKRLPFTVEEIQKMIHDFPAPWSDMVAVSWYGYGLRLSDVCLMRWESVNWKKGCIRLVEKKTKKERGVPLLPPLRSRLLRLRDEQGGREEYLFPVMAHFYLGGCQGYVSTQFTALLRAQGMIPAPLVEQKKGERRHNVSPKSFHSIRHAVVSCLRADASLSADVVRDAVGHDSEAVERGYFTATMEARRRAGAPLLEAESAAPAMPDAPRYGATA